MQNGIVLWADKTGKISKSDIANTCPDISIFMIERTLKEMLDKGEISKVGSGQATSYVTLSVTQFE
jgi:predicted HTH transcriptional regulator